MMNLYYDGDEKGRWSYNDLIAKYGYSKQAIQRLVNIEKANGRTRNSKKRPDPRRMESNSKPISRMHSLIGAKLSTFRIRMGWKQTRLGMELNMSRTKITLLEMGCYDLTLSQIHAICALMDTKISEFVNDNIPLSTTVNGGRSPSA